MTEEIKTQFRREGEPAFPADTEKETTAASSAGEETKTGTEAPAASKDKKPEDEDIPFHQHPRWTEREKEWNDRFNAQEQRHQDDLKAIRDEFGAARKANANETQIPSWFGGSQEQWEAYRKDRDTEIAQAEERAIKRVTEAKGAEDKAVKEATDYMNSEISAIEADKTLNPKGEKIDAAKLLKYVLDNDMVDSKGRWNYRAAHRAMRAEAVSADAGKPNRKDIAGATTSEATPETKPSAFKTQEDFKKNRPW